VPMHGSVMMKGMNAELTPIRGYLINRM
jgi:hypothetical protein